MFSGGSLIAADNTWILWAIVVGAAAISILFEQKFTWAQKLSGPVIALIFSVVLSNTHIIPYSSPVYGNIEDYLVPIGIVMLLFRADIKSIIKDSGKSFLCFNISSVGTVAGTIVAFFLLRGALPELDKMAGVLTGSYIGGGVNLFAVASSTDLSETMLSAEVVADNFVMTIAFLAMMWLPTSAIGRKLYNHPHVDKLEASGAASDGQNITAAYWGAKEIKLLDIALEVAIAFAICAFASTMSGIIKAHTTGLVNTVCGNMFVLLTLTTVTCVSLFPEFFKNLKGSQEIGTFCMYIFFVIIGCPADLKSVILDAPLLFVFCGVIVLINILLTFGVGKLLKLNSEEMATAVICNIGGPSSGASIAVAKGWDALVVPSILVGIWGYIIGTPLGLIMVEFLSKYTIL